MTTEDRNKIELAKELTLKALETNMLVPDRDNKSNASAIGAKIAELFNVILKDIQC